MNDEHGTRNAAPGRSVPGRSVFRVPCSTFTPAVMAILNVTPDSFSDGGMHFDRDKAIDAALRMEQDGASIIDVGGESTRPGSEEVPVQEEFDRIVPVIEGIRSRSGVRISIDTRKARVAAAARCGRGHRQRCQRAAS